MRHVQATQYAFRNNLIDGLHVLVLWNFAIAQPLYDLLGGNAEFFVAHRVGPTGILIFVLTLSIVIPLAIALFETAFGKISLSAGRLVHLAVVFLLAGVLAAPLVNRIPGLPVYAEIAGAVAVGGLFSILYTRSSVLRTFVSVLCPGIVAFPILFMAFTPVSTLVFPHTIVRSEDGNTNGGSRPAKSAPIVLVIFDEFELSALLDENKEIDPVRFPNLAAFAKGSWWFPHATTAWTETKRAVPAILTGLEPRDRAAIPVLQSHPNNLFTWLGGAYKFNVSETLTKLCPAEFCPETSREARTGLNPKLFVSDLAIIGLHVVLPSSISKKMLPPMDTGWKGFGRGEAAGSDEEIGAPAHSNFRDRDQLFANFLDGIHPDEASSLNFLHILMPHVPYTYLPSGVMYNGGDTDGLLGRQGITDKVWADDDVLRAIAYQRYLLQVGYADTLVGKLLERLKSLGMYDNALIVLTSDHGKSFRAGEPKRFLTSQNAPELLQVPLFLKVPGQTEGRKSARHVSNIDILPTISDVLKINLPWRTDGRSMVDPSAPDRETVEIRDLDAGRASGRYSLNEMEYHPQLAWKLANFGSRTPLGHIAISDRNSNLVGRKISDLPVAEEMRGWNVESEQFAMVGNVYFASGVLPALVQGHIRTESKPTEAVRLAIALNGVVRVTTRTTDWGGSGLYFSAMLPESAFSQGRNVLEVFNITDEGENRLLHRISTPVPGEFRLTRASSGEETLVSDDGSSITLKPDAVKGYLDLVVEDSNWCYLIGWSMDGTYLAPASNLIVFVDNKLIYSGKPNSARPDIGKFFDAESAVGSGFRFRIPRQALKEGNSWRIFGVSKTGFASEVPLNPTAQATLRRISQ